MIARKRLVVIVLLFVFSIGYDLVSASDILAAVSAPSEPDKDYQTNDIDKMKTRIGFELTRTSEPSVRGYIGVKKCSVCHNSESKGYHYKIWKSSAHARAFETLGTPEAKALGKRLGIPDPQQSGKCLRCHSTAYAFGEQRVTDAIPIEEGISCETCHGEGKDYMKIETMKDRKKALAAGLIIPDEKTCLKCHNETAPNVKEFNYQESWDKIKHYTPKK